MSDELWTPLYMLLLVFVLITCVQLGEWFGVFICAVALVALEQKNRP